jgi:hypothetical protein
MMRTVPQAQQYPASLIKVGAVLYSVFAYTDDDGKTSTGYEDWIVRSVKAKRGSKSRMGHAIFASGDTRQHVNLTQKVEGVTWVKRAGKTGWATSIPEYLQNQFTVGDRLPRGLYTTHRAALVYAIRSHQDMYKRYDQWIAEETDPEALAGWHADKATHEAELKALAIRFKKGWPTIKPMARVRDSSSFSSEPATQIR